MIEALFVIAIPALLLEGFDHEQALTDGNREEEASGTIAGERQRLIDAVLTGEDQQIDAALELLFTSMSPEAATARRAVTSNRRVRRLDAVRSFRAWADQERQGRTEESRAEARTLNRLLRTWFTGVTIDMDEASIEITAHRRSGAGEFAPPPAAAHFDRRELARLGYRRHRRHQQWGEAEIVGALQAWAETHGRSPTWTEWRKADAMHPGSITVIQRYGKWSRALRRAGLKPSEPTMPPRNWPWKDMEIITALRDWTAEHGRLPTWADWLGATPRHPCTHTVQEHFGNWRNGLVAAGLASPPLPPR
jgi:hypothetical protein